MIFKKKRHNVKKIIECEINATTSMLNQELQKKFHNYKKIHELRVQLKYLNGNLIYLSEL